MTEIVGKVTELHDLLVAEGVLDAEGHSVSGRYHSDVGGALWNYLLVAHEDMIGGVHNPDYALALLNNSILKLTPAP